MPDHSAIAGIPMTGVVQVITAICGVMTTVGIAFIGFMAGKTRTREKIRIAEETTRQQEIALKVEQVRLQQIRTRKEQKALAQATDVKLGRISSDVIETKQTTKKTLDHVNSERTALLRVVAVALRGTANATHAPGDVEAAEEAERLYQENLAGQKRVDSRAEAENRA